MDKWLIEYWAELRDMSADLYIIVEARNEEEAIEIARSRERCAKHITATIATKSDIEIYDR